MKPFLKRGFTLIELLVVITIIILLTAVVLVAVNEVRQNARDKTRVSDLEQIKAALTIYATANGTFWVAGAGSNGQGWFAYENGSSYPESIADELFDLGILTTVMHDPLVPAGSAGANGHRQYMNYFHNPGGATKGTCLFAQLENPNASHEAAFDAAPIAASTKTSLETNYNMNYATCTP